MWLAHGSLTLVLGGSIAKKKQIGDCKISLFSWMISLEIILSNVLWILTIHQAIQIHWPVSMDATSGLNILFRWMRPGLMKFQISWVLISNSRDARMSWGSLSTPLLNPLYRPTHWISLESWRVPQSLRCFSNFDSFNLFPSMIFHPMGLMVLWFPLIFAYISQGAAKKHRPDKQSYGRHIEERSRWGTGNQDTYYFVCSLYNYI